VEVKNLNSIRNVKRAIEFEVKRLIDLLDNGDTIQQQTRSFNADNGTTFAIRDKEEADDYRYFPEPDLTPFHLQDKFIEKIRKSIPALPEERIKRYTSELQLSLYDATVLTEEKNTAEYFEAILLHTDNNKAAANWMLGPVRSWLNENGKDINEFLLTPQQIASLIKLTEGESVSFSIASTKLFTLLMNNPGKQAADLAAEHNLLQQSDVSAIGPIIDAVLDKFAAKVIEYKKGKKGLLALFVGEVMKQTKGKADPKVTNELLIEKLKS
jgi:aspartyl-tRNA(Asn)/glutamyl-tRNA(Gln) amidotransferase subunit B